MALNATADRIEKKLDDFVFGLLILDDIGKALPHPYDAIGDYARQFAHDFANSAYEIRKYIEQTRPRETGRLEVAESRIAAALAELDAHPIAGGPAERLRAILSGDAE